MPLNKEEIIKLLAVANATEKNAYIFKSNHAFGAAVLTTDGEIYGGCNIDGVISSQGACAEMVALHNAVAHGKYQIRAVLVTDENEFTYPCGSCLQLIFQFYQSTGEDIEVIAAKTNGEFQIKKLTELLPEGYKSSSFADKLANFVNK